MSLVSVLQKESIETSRALGQECDWSQRLGRALQTGWQMDSMVGKLMVRCYTFPLR